MGLAAMDAGAIAAQPVAPLAHVIMGALHECALYVARAEDPPCAREECTAIFDRILRGIGEGPREASPEPTPSRRRTAQP